MSILDRIVAYKKEFVAQSRDNISLEEIKRHADEAAPAKDFLAALRNCRDIAVIAEIKKASPSKGIIREDFDPVEIAKGYESSGATAISCLTDEKFFQGSLNIFRQVREVTNLPLLRKEFIIDEYQIYEARAAGADLVLLITCILTDAQLRHFRALIESLGMAALVETHSAEDARRASAAGARLIGINNRNLDSTDFHTDIRHTEKILPLLPEAALRVSESGISTPRDVEYLRALGVEAVLVGEQLMRQDDPGAAIQALLGKHSDA